MVRELAQRVNANERFRAATSTWDGSIGLAAEREEVEFIIYRGEILEAAAFAQRADVTLVASELTWAQMISGPTNDFMRRAMQDAFSVRGAAHEYLRLIRAIDVHRLARAHSTTKAPVMRAEYRDVDGVASFVEQWGSGQPVLCIHTAGQNGVQWRGVAPGLVARGYRVVVPDLPGTVVRNPLSTVQFGTCAIRCVV